MTLLKSQDVPGVILAGGKAKPDLQAFTGQTNRALVVVQGKTLLSHVVDALQTSEGNRPITVVGEVPENENYTRLPDKGDFVSNICAGVSCYAESPYVLIATSDLPFLNAEVVQGFVEGAKQLAEQSGAKMVWPVVPVAKCYERFPGVKRTSIRLKEGDFTGGNLALVRPDFLLTQQQPLADSYAARKSPLRMAQLLGLGTLVRLLLSQKVSPNLLTIAFLEARVSRLLGGTARALVCDWVELATDLDRPADFAAVGLEVNR